MPPRSTPGCCAGSIRTRAAGSDSRRPRALLSPGFYPEDTEEGEELASGTDFAQRLFSASRDRMSKTASGSSTACRIAPSCSTGCARRPRPAT
jgi:hypothetical protein